jgi:SAM-dependent methyltransferase
VTRERASSVLAARAQAQRLAFGPMMFQALRVLWKSGALAAIEAAGDEGLTVRDIGQAAGMSDYGAGVLCDAAASAGALAEQQGCYTITSTGSMLLHDRLTQVNVDFVHDVCYQGMFHLDEAIREGRPAGLKVFSEADTIYQCVPELPAQAQQSWYAFDHYYSDRAFTEAARIVFVEPVARLLDVGGNTGRWARRCIATDPEVQVTIADLPGQIARAGVELSDVAARVGFHPVDLLAPEPELPAGFDVVWMSQFLDCFSEAQIAGILRAARTALAPGGKLFVLEPLVDRQRFEAASYSLNAISLYFTALANGTSRMYRGTTLERLILEAGYTDIVHHDGLGIGHTLLECELGAAG